MSETEIPNMDDSEILYRQIHPSWIEDGLPTSQGFRPTPKDEGQLSVDRSTIFTAQESFILHTQKKSLASVGTFGVSKGEFNQEKICCNAAPIREDPANPAHALADYTPHSTTAQKNISKRLRNLAVGRGCFFQPDQ